MENSPTFAPYASPENIIRVFERVRRGGVKRVDDDFLTQIGIGDGMLNRTQRALEFIAFTNPDGTLTQLADRFVVASEEESKAILQDSLRRSYDSIFRAVDPTTDERGKIATAFRTMEPSGQWGRMVTLFLGLCQWTGMNVKAPPTNRPGKDSPPKERPAGQSSRRSSRSRSAATPVVTPSQNGFRPMPSLDPALAGLVAKLASIKTTEDLDRWWTALRSTFEFVHSETANE